ncbi:MAG TPA: sigma-70 family RNA polymerase sigma factor [candidate division Zixibacteria bacterium]|nr:sigma-70 family RNA polymerase sigma factor [candidate division Zixibacteria bacterium]
MKPLRREENPNSPVSNSEKWPNERKLLEAAQNGDQKAYGVLIRQNQKKMFRFVYGILGNFDAAEDIVQEAFIKGWEAIRSFQPGYAFYPWISTIARNLTYNWIHREERKESLEKLQEKGYDPESVDLGPFENLLEKEGSQKLYQAIQALPVEFRTVFVMRQFEQLSYEEIALFLKIPPGTVDSRLHRARKMLMEALKDFL